MQEKMAESIEAMMPVKPGQILIAMDVIGAAEVILPKSKPILKTQILYIQQMWLPGNLLMAEKPGQVSGALPVAMIITESGSTPSTPKL